MLIGVSSRIRNAEGKAAVLCKYSENVPSFWNLLEESKGFVARSNRVAISVLHGRSESSSTAVNVPPDEGAGSGGLVIWIRPCIPPTTHDDLAAGQHAAFVAEVLFHVVIAVSIKVHLHQDDALEAMEALLLR